MNPATNDQLQARAWNALTRAKKPLTVAQLAKTARLTDGAALTYLRDWTTTGQLTRLPATGAPAPYLDQYATPALISRLDPCRRHAMTSTQPDTTAQSPVPHYRNADTRTEEPHPQSDGAPFVISDPGRNVANADHDEQPRPPESDDVPPPPRRLGSTPFLGAGIRGTGVGGAHIRQPSPIAPTVSSALIRAALDYAKRGWHVFPLVPGAKRPAVKDWENRATTDPARIERCWTSGPYGIGIACGPSGLVVIDLDQPKPDTATPPQLWNIPGVRDGGDVFAVVCATAFQPVPWDTYTVRTGRGGAHAYYAHPTDADGWHGPPLRNTAGALGWLIDTRAHGGYVVAPPTTVDGRTYDVDMGGPVAPLPLWLAHALTPPEMPAQRPVTVALADAVEAGGDRRAAYLRAALTRQIGAVLAAPEGGRNHALYLSAVALGQLAAGGELEEGAVSGLLENAAETAGLTHFEAARTVASGMRAGAKRPRTITTERKAA